MVEIGFCLGSVTWLLIEWLRFFPLCFFTCSKFHSNPRLYPLTHTVPHQSPLSFQFSLLTPHSSPIVWTPQISLSFLSSDTRCVSFPFPHPVFIVQSFLCFASPLGPHSMARHDDMFFVSRRHCSPSALSEEDCTKTLKQIEPQTQRRSTVVSELIR